MTAMRRETGDISAPKKVGKKLVSPHDVLEKIHDVTKAYKC